jgi:hypothetical protein
MSQIELYQSVLLKLGQLQIQDLAALNDYLATLTKKQKTRIQQEGIAHLAGAWKQWDDIEFEGFLSATQHIRKDMFIPRQIEL